MTSAREHAVIAAKARHLLAVGRTTEAREVIARGLAESPDSPELHALMAQALLAANDPGGGLEHASRACGLSPDSAWHHRLRAIAHEALGSRGDALAAAKEAVRLEPADWNNYAILSRTAAAVSPKGSLAQEAADRAAELAPWAAGAHFAVGYAAHRADRRGAARAAYRRVLQIDPGNSAAINNLGVLDGVRFGRSATNFLRAAQADPTDDVAAGNLRAYPDRLWIVWFVACTAAMIVAGALNSTDDHAASRAIGVGLPLLFLVHTALTLRKLPRAVVRHVLQSTVWTRHWGVGSFLALGALAATEGLCFFPDAMARWWPDGVPPVFLFPVVMAVVTKMVTSKDR